MVWAIAAGARDEVIGGTNDEQRITSRVCLAARRDAGGIQRHLHLSGELRAGLDGDDQRPADSIRAGDAQNGKSITLHPGQTLIVTLSSTYWSFQGSSNPQIVASVGAPVASPAPFDQHGVPGSGAGSVSQEYRAVASGTAQVTASRVSCGEAMKCVGASGQYQLTVRVTATSS